MDDVASWRGILYVSKIISGINTVTKKQQRHHPLLILLRRFENAGTLLFHLPCWLDLLRQLDHSLGTYDCLRLDIFHVAPQRRRVLDFLPSGKSFHSDLLCCLMRVLELLALQPSLVSFLKELHFRSFDSERSRMLHIETTFLVPRA